MLMQRLLLMVRKTMLLLMLVGWSLLLHMSGHVGAGNKESGPNLWESVARRNAGPRSGVDRARGLYKRASDQKYCDQMSSVYRVVGLSLLSGQSELLWPNQKSGGGQARPQQFFTQNEATLIVRIHSRRLTMGAETVVDG